LTINYGLKLPEHCITKAVEEKGNGFIFGENLKEVEGAALKRFAKDENI